MLRVSARMKGKVFTTVVRPEVLHGLETVALRKRQEVEFEVVEIKLLRLSLRVMRMDRIRNENIRETTHVRCSGQKVRDQTEMVWTCTERRIVNISVEG